MRYLVEGLVCKIFGFDNSLGGHIKTLLLNSGWNANFPCFCFNFGHLNQGRRKESRARGADWSKRALTTLGQQIYPRNGGHPRHFLGNIMDYASHSHINDCLFQSNIACC